MPTIIRYKPKHPCPPYHFSNPLSAGSLICETKDFPLTSEEGEYWSFTVWLDHVRRQWPWRFANAAGLLELSPWQDLHVWTKKLSQNTPSEEVLRRVAQCLVSQPSPAVHVRVVYYYNVSSGLDCPVVEALFKKE
jgi:hypothetical protein